MIRTMYNLSKVEAYLDHLEKKGVKAFYSPIKAGDKIIYKIRRGVFKDKTLAAKAKHELAKKYHMEASLETLR